MMKPFTKRRLLKVLETKAKQVQAEWYTLRFGNLHANTPYKVAEDLHNPHAMLLHGRYNAYLSMIWFLKEWDRQNEAFLDPAHVNINEDGTRPDDGV